MPSDNFEQSLRKRLSGVEFPPNPEVWEGIKTRLQGPKWYQKKGWIWGMAASVSLLLGIGAYIWLYPPRHVSLEEVQTTVSVDSSTQNQESILPGSSQTDSLSQYTDRTLEKISSNTNLQDVSTPRPQTQPSGVAGQGLNSDKKYTGIPVENSPSTSALERTRPASEVLMDEELSLLETSPSSITLRKVDIPALSMIEDLYPLSGPFEAVSVNAERMSGAALPSPSKFSFTFFARPEMIWYTSASISGEQEPIRDFERADSFSDFPAATQNAPSIVFYEATYARTGFSSGVTMGYYLGPKLSLHTGMSLFVSGKHKLSPLYPLVGSDSSGIDPSLPEFTMRNIHLEFPLTAQYIFASERSSWVFTGGVSFNKSLNTLDFGPGSDPNLEAQALGAFGPYDQPLLTQKSSHIHASLGFMYRFHVNSHLNLYVGPTHNYSLSPVYTTAQGKSIFLNRLALQVGVEFR
ncbi:MAG: hypothetical protein AAGA10_02070 [Bacteroidota bacterium]